MVLGFGVKMSFGGMSIGIKFSGTVSSPSGSGVLSPAVRKLSAEEELEVELGDLR